MHNFTSNGNTGKDEIELQKLFTLSKNKEQNEPLRVQGLSLKWYPFRCRFLDNGLGSNMYHFVPQAGTEHNLEDQ